MVKYNIHNRTLNHDRKVFVGPVCVEDVIERDAAEEEVAFLRVSVGMTSPHLWTRRDKSTRTRHSRQKPVSDDLPLQFGNSRLSFQQPALPSKPCTNSQHCPYARQQSTCRQCKPTKDLSHTTTDSSRAGCTYLESSSRIYTPS